MKNEITFSWTQSNFWITSSSMDNSSINSDAYNWSGASFYTMPEWDNENLLWENEDLKSEISMLEVSISNDPKYWTFAESMHNERLELDKLKEIDPEL